MAVLQNSDSTELKTEKGDLSVEDEIIEYFVSFVQMLGLPKSVGQIYGTLFASADPLAMDDIISRLGISKGSASQGLNLLRSLGAVQSQMTPGDRREYFSADLNVSRIVHHFFEERLLPRIQNGAERVELILSEIDPEEDEDQRVMYDRVKALKKWQKRGDAIVPRVIKWLRR